MDIVKTETNAVYINILLQAFIQNMLTIEALKLILTSFTL